MSGSVLTGRGSVLTSAGDEGGSGLDDDTWYAREALAHARAVPELTESIPIQIGVANLTEAIGANVVDANAEGGAIRSNGTWGLLMKSLPVQNLLTSAWAVSFQGVISVIGAPGTSLFGMSNAAGSQAIAVGTGITFDASHFILFGSDGTPTATVVLGTADIAIHTWRLLHRPANGQVRVEMDGVQVGVLSDAALHFPTGAAGPALYNAGAAALGQKLYKAIMSFVGPS